MGTSATTQAFRRLIRETRSKSESANAFDFLIENDLRVEHVFNLSGYYEYHVLNKNNECIAKNTARPLAIQSAMNILR
ncbi:hypothetical protein F892_03089 [Acinetobacter vivianii]|uniref:Uncharacterized protein n=1 Tax=Acinetobacter vivianii TaxID=1776742 RepID=N9PR58_9GAMM|nr:hypothetical protein [Acinetobacter vivianii]ENX20166.1 hypothetical protein F892_03089 [Acinetobacter vivianii]GGI59387.1 hypothetical protein GCM10011446_08820 [Acinetobacter vivianii]